MRPSSSPTPCRPTPFGGATGEGTESYTAYDEDGNVTDSDSYEITVGYGPAWFNFLNPDTVTTSITGGLLKHEVSDAERSLTVEFIDPHTPQTARDAIVPPEVEPEEWTNANGQVPSSFSVSYVDEENGDTRLAGASCRRVKFRWRVPESFPGSYFKVVWDEVFFPDGWDATIDDPDWQDLEVPENVGELRVVNVGVICYRSPFGSKPTMHGEEWTPTG